MSNYSYCVSRAGREEVREGREGREVVSFDMDLMDCTVLACVLSAYCPFLVSPHNPFNLLHIMYIFIDTYLW